jgi:hypothetical protein
MEAPHFKIILLLATMVLEWSPASADVTDDMCLLRNRCLYYAAGRAHNDVGTVSIRYGLWVQSPFSPAGKIDLAASGFSLAALPAAVAAAVLTEDQGAQIAATAAALIREMATKSAAAASQGAVALYGYRGILYHYYEWNATAGEFRAKSVEVSSIDTTLLMLGLSACAQRFGGTVMSDYTTARDLIDWRSWLDTVTPGHQNQFHVAYDPAFCGERIDHRPGHQSHRGCVGQFD